MKDEFPLQLLAEARKHPEGWVYEIDERFDPNGDIPPDGIIRAWKVSSTGEPTGEVWENPYYKSVDSA